MTAIIDNIVVTGTPEEINDLINMRGGGSTVYPQFNQPAYPSDYFRVGDTIPNPLDITISGNGTGSSNEGQTNLTNYEKGNLELEIKHYFCKCNIIDN